MQVMGLIHTKDGKLVGGCNLTVDDTGTTVTLGDGSELTRISPAQYLDIGYPGFFAGRAYLELPLSEEKVLHILLRRPDLQQFREAIDQVIGRDFPDQLEPKLQSHRQKALAGLGTFVAGSIICLIGHFMAKGIGIGIIFYGIPIFGIAMICNNVSHMRRIRRIMQQNPAQTTDPLADSLPPN